MAYIFCFCLLLSTLSISIKAFQTNILPLHAFIRKQHITACKLNASSSAASSVVCVGEALWDALPDGIYLGGAPANVAIHLSELSGDTTEVSLAACVGMDRLGTEVQRRLELRGVSTLLQRSEAATGMVVAELSETGDATYTFDTPAAWDYLRATPELLQRARTANVVVIGSLAGRLGCDDGATSRDAICELRSVCQPDSVVLDVNLRAPWYTPEAVLDLAGGGETGGPLALIKVNDDELAIMEGWLNTSGTTPVETALGGEGLEKRMGALGRVLNAKRVCVTRGERGAALWCDDSDHESTTDTFAEHPGYPISKIGDTVGAGDAFLAALIRSLLLERESNDLALSRACAIGAYVSQCRGAVPRHVDAPEELQTIFSFV